MDGFTIVRQKDLGLYVLTAPKVLNRWTLTAIIEDDSDRVDILYKNVAITTIPKNGTFPQTFMRWLKANGVQGIAARLYEVQEATEDLAPGRDYNKVVEFAEAERRVTHDGFTL